METGAGLRAGLLRAARAAAGIQQVDAAAGAGIAENTLIDAEHGRRCSDRTFRRLAEVYRRRGVEIAVAVDGASGYVMVRGESG